MMNLPKDDSRFSWTRHIKNKMLFYHISKTSVINIFRKPERYEEGIAQDTVAAMRVKKSRSKSGPKENEVWLMYKLNDPKKRKKTDKKSSSKVLLISTWIYPGRTKKGDSIPIPEDILAEIQKIL